MASLYATTVCLLRLQETEPHIHIFLQLKTKYLVKDGVKRVNKYCTLHPQTHHMVAASSSGGQSQKARS